MKDDLLERLDGHWEERVDQQNLSIWETIVLRVLLLIEYLFYQMTKHEPTPPRETTLRLLIIVAGLVLIVMAMVAGGAANEIDEVIKHLPFLH